MKNVFSLVREALRHAGEDQLLADRLSLLEERRITPYKVLPPMEFLFRLFGTPCFPRGELVGITGKPKSGKTFVSTILMMLCFIDNLLELSRASPGRLKVLWLDTEQSDESTHDILTNRMLPMLKRYFPPEICDEIEYFMFGGEEPHFQIFNVRQDPWQERMPLLEAAVERFSPDLVIVDGIRDLVNDINDGVLAQEVVERLMHLASEQHCCMVCILHQNKSAEDRNLRGWIGTELTHKAFEVYECEKSETRIFSLKQNLTRKYDISDVMKYVTDGQGIPVPATAEALAAAAEGRPGGQGREAGPPLNREFISEWVNHKPVFDLQRVFAHVLPEEGKCMSGREMQSRVMTLLGISSPFVFDNLRRKALMERVIVKSIDAKGYVYYHRPVPPGSTDGRQEMVQGKLFAEDAPAPDVVCDAPAPGADDAPDADSPPTFDLMGDGPIDDLPF